MKGKGILNTMVLLILVLLCFNGMVYVNSQKVPAMFVFGDSIVEVGNNNFLNTLAKSNYYPYGIDYNRVATGRFSNGRSLIDFIGIYLIQFIYSKIYFSFVFISVYQNSLISLNPTRCFS